MKNLTLMAAGLAALACSLAALAGPDFAVIEKGRAAKRAEQRAQRRVLQSDAASEPAAVRPQPEQAGAADQRGS
ncbi:MULTISPECIES: hypothetical protein [Cupriavidus]|uniref:hypothetical protein n=1 Tax=Cupriavidus TaxID=106589 RepID=UPI0003A6CD52|nr:MULTISPECIES: hypothetical protein [Cupriavidus]